jgi:uncharacterized protein
MALPERKQLTVNEHLFGPGPKRMLALDGGGVRGILSLGYLSHIEEILQNRCGNDFRLCDYFDLIGGTSTGAIIATGLALGFRVNELQELYHQLAGDIFKKPFWRLGLIGSKFPKDPLERALREAFGETTLGSDRLRTGLMIVTKRLDTGSPWVIHNSSHGLFFDSPGKGKASSPNRDFVLRHVLRASTAAPHYFEPERMEVAPGLEGVFVDGGMSPFNNPALQMLLMATQGGFGLKWPLGAENLLLVSVGTGYRELRLPPGDVMKMPAGLLALRALGSLMADCDWLSQTILQWMSDSPTRWDIDQEIGNLQGNLLGGLQWLSYLRYNVHLVSGWLKEKLNIDLEEQEAAALFNMDAPQNVERLREIAAVAASAQVKAEHFPKGFDIS